MKVLVIACLGVLALAQQPRVNVRTLAADQLRDYPGLCFSSTNLNFYTPGMEWSLFPFCGAAQCVQDNNGNLIERVTDCGPQPKPNPQCEIANLAELQRNDTVLEFPKCCPVHRCAEGVTLEYPTEAEIQAEIQKQRIAAVDQIKNAATGGPAPPAPSA